MEYVLVPPYIELGDLRLPSLARALRVALLTLLMVMQVIIPGSVAIQDIAATPIARDKEDWMSLRLSLGWPSNDMLRFYTARNASAKSWLHDVSFIVVSAQIRADTEDLRTRNAMLLASMAGGVDQPANIEERPRQMLPFEFQRWLYQYQINRSMIGALSALGLGTWAADATARPRSGRSVGVTFPGCPFGLGRTDRGGNPDDCNSSTLNPSYQNSTFFDSSRQSGQGVYALNDANLLYNKSCVDNGCGYDTTQLVNDPADLYGTSSTATISAGKFTVSDSNINANGGNFATLQALSGIGISTITPPHLTALISHIAGVQVWQTDQPALTVSGSPGITGRRLAACDYNLTRGAPYGYTVPSVFCGSSAGTVLNGYNFRLHGDGIILYYVAGATMSGVSVASNNSFGCNINLVANAIRLGSGQAVTGDFTIIHNQFDGGYPGTGLTCNGVNNGSAGTSVKSQTTDIEWNAYINQAVLPNSGTGAFLNILVQHNAFPGFNLSGAFHGAVYANSVGYNPALLLRYKQNMVLWPSSGPANLGTTSLSVLSNASLAAPNQGLIYKQVDFLGNLIVCNKSGGIGGLQAVQSCFNQNVGAASWGIVNSTGNLMDPTGGAGCVAGSSGFGGVQATLVPNVGQGTTTMTILSGSGSNTGTYMGVGAWYQIGNTPVQVIGSMSGSNVLTLDPSSSGTNIPIKQPLSGWGVQPGLYVVSKTDSTHYVMSATATFSLTHLIYAGTLMAFGTVDQATGLASTGGLNPAVGNTYILAGEYATVNSPLKTTAPLFTSLNINTSDYVILDGSQFKYEGVNLSFGSCFGHI